MSPDISERAFEDDPRYDKDKASYLLRSFVELHPHAIRLERQAGELDPQQTKDHTGPRPEELEPLSQIIAELNDFFVRSGPETVKLSPESAAEHIRTRFRSRTVAPGRDQ
jgi:hypothetical protein